MKREKSKRIMKERRHRRIRAKACGTAEKPRLNVFRSNRYIYLQLVDDEKGKTLVWASDIKQKTSRSAGAKKNKLAKIKSAFEVGKRLAQSAKKKKIKRIVFDRGGYAYHGRVKAAAEGSREGGLIF